MDSSRPIDRATHTSVLMSAVTLKRNDLVNIAIRHLHNPPGQSVDLSMVDDALLQEYNQLVQANIEAPEPYLERSSRDSSPVMSIRSGSSASSKSSQASFDPRDVFDQVLNSMIERLNLVMPAIKGTRFNRLIGKDRSRRTSLVACLRRFRDDRLNSHFGMSDGARRLKFGSSGFSKEYLRCRGECAHSLTSCITPDDIIQILLTLRSWTYKTNSFVSAKTKTLGGKRLCEKIKTPRSGPSWRSGVLV